MQVTPERWQQVKKVLAAALERQGDQRMAYLKQACAGDDALRQEVESLLAEEKGAEGFLEVPALEIPSSMFDQDPNPSLCGQQLGSYKVLSLLGAGGMGEVYEAHDTKLGRKVAIKILPSAFVHDSERLSRFQREARVLAALNHPNIATIHGLEESGGVHYLVMELVPGETLAERVRAGPLAVGETLRICSQVAEALEAAHEKGVIHRDLKPANVKVTPEGRVKVLDFGLAKAFAGDGGEDLSLGPTLTAVGTEEGRILGTPAYMSPEQARGKVVDKRTDIWSFGCLLYELLTGQPIFRGETLSDTLAAVLGQEPDWRALPAETPAKVCDLLRRCLQKDARQRLHDIADARIEIEETLTAPRTALPIVSTTGRAPGWLQRIPWGIAFVIGAVLMTTVVWFFRRTPPTVQQPVSRFVITLPAGQQLAGLDNGPAVAVSPDGTHIAYVAQQGGNQELYLRSLDGLEAKPVPNTEGAVNPFFSPDGQWLGFIAGGKLKKVSINGGTALTLEDAATIGFSWNNRGVIAFAPSYTSGLLQVSDAGGNPQPLTRLEKGEIAHRWPEFLPDGKEVLFAVGTSISNWTNAQVAVQSVGADKRRNLIQGGMQPRYAPSGHLIYAQGGKLMAVPFDPRRLEVTGTALPVVDGVLQSPYYGIAQYSISATGSLVYVPAALQATRRALVWVNRNGAERPLAAPPRSYRNPALSPDGRRIAVDITDSEDQIWLYDLSRETLTPITFGGNDATPVWTPDGKRIALLSYEERSPNLFWQLADGSGRLERLTTSEYSQIPKSWSPDGQLLAFTQAGATTGLDIWVLHLGDHKAQPFLQTPADESVPQFSPDGHWLAYVSDESGRPEIYVRPYPGPGGKWQISTEGGKEPVWNRNGRELFYRSDNKMMAVEIATHPSFVAGKPRMLFEGPYLATPLTSPYYDVSPDGQRFLMLKPTVQAQAAPTQINVVLSWFEELKRRVPANK
jgi:serine/threonine protein kinase/Tol biopolymer transport system component